MRHLTLGDLDAHLENIIALYRAAFAFGSGFTQRQRASVVSQFDFLFEMLSSIGRKSAATRKNMDALAKLRATFGSEC